MTAALLFAVVDDNSGSRNSRGGAHNTRGFTLPTDLVVRLRARDTTALDALIDAAFTPLVRFANSFVCSYDTAEDIVQEVFVRVWSHSETWTTDIALIPYLYAAVRNRAHNVLRARATEARLYDEHQTIETDRTPEGLSPEHTVRWHELTAAFDRALAALTERQRSALLLRFEQGRTVPEIAQILGISLKAAEKLVSRGLRELRARMAGVLD